MRVGCSEFKESDINTEPKAAFETLKQIKYTVKSALVSSKNAKQPILEQWQKVKIFLYIISRIDPVTPEFRYGVILFVTSITFIVFMAIE